MSAGDFIKLVGIPSISTKLIEIMYNVKNFCFIGILQIHIN